MPSASPVLKHVVGVGAVVSKRAATLLQQRRQAERRRGGERRAAEAAAAAAPGPFSPSSCPRALPACCCSTGGLGLGLPQAACREDAGWPAATWYRPEGQPQPLDGAGAAKPSGGGAARLAPPLPTFFMEGQAMPV